ncbi:MAG: DUF5343 domain-containing protein [bacterium]
MADNPPFMNAHGSIAKILNKIKTAKTPERFTQDYLATKLGFPGGSAKAFIPLAKRLGLLGTDGTPTELYKKFRNSAQSKSAIAEAMRQGYLSIFERNEFAYNLSKKDLKGLVMQITGLGENNSRLNGICGTFEALKEFADFESNVEIEHPLEDDNEKNTLNEEIAPDLQNEEIKLNLAYTINLVLPKTDDISVFNAIFKSLKMNLLRK